MKTRLIAIILAFILCLSFFTGCGKTQDPIAEDPAASPEPEEPVDAAPAEPVVYTTFDYASAYKSYAPDSVVMTVNDTEITWKEYYGWLYSIMEQYEMYIGTEFAWTDLYSDTHTLEEYAKYYTETMCAQYAVVAQEAEIAGFELTEEEELAIDEMLASDAENYTGGDIDSFIEFLEATYMDEEYYHYIQACAIYYQRLYEENFGAEGDKLSDEDVEDFLSANGFLYAKHILFLTQDQSGAPLEDSAKAEKLALAEETLAQLKSAKSQDELLSKFDELMNSLSEDTGLAAYPDGYYFLPGEMVSEFEEGTKALENYAFSDIVETSYGYHIILRLPIGPDDLYDSGVSFRTLAAQYAFDTMMGEKFQDAVIAYSDEFTDFNLASIMNTIEVEG